MTNPVKWVRIRVKALSLALKVRRVTREMRETNRRLKAGLITRNEAKRRANALRIEAQKYAKAGL